MTENADLAINYSVRVSTRAKHVRLTISAQQGLVVVVPKGFSQSQLPALLAKRRDWIERVSKQYSLQVDKAPDLCIPLPEQITLSALDEVWTVSYRETVSSRVSARTCEQSQQINVTGNIADVAACRRALRRWLYRHAQQHLVPWLRQCSEELALPFTSASIKGQKTRWASCSGRKTINLNFQLLFLDSSAVNYVFIHELCHTRHMNHSPTFWRLLESMLPDYQRIHKNMRTSWQHIPAWLGLSD